MRKHLQNHFKEIAKYLEMTFDKGGRKRKRFYFLIEIVADAHASAHPEEGAGSQVHDGSQLEK